MFSQENKVRVTAESASIYAKPNIKSYVIETVKKETVLNLFQSQKLSRIWYYVSYYSEKRKAYISGFAKVTAVEIIDHIQKKSAKIEKELKKREKSAISPAIIKQLGNPRQMQNKKKEIRQKEMLPRETKIRPVPAKSSSIQKRPKEKKVKVTAESANIYAKPDIKSQVIETVKKDTILNLSRTQKKPRIWNNITLYSEKRKAYISGFVKVTAVARIDPIQKESKEIKEKLKKEEKKTFVSPSPAIEIISIKKLEKEAPKIKKLPVELEIKPMHLKTSDIQRSINQVQVSLQDSLAETAYEVKKSLKAEQNELKKEEKPTTQAPQIIDKIVTIQKPKNWKEKIKGEEELSVTFYTKKRVAISQRLNEEKEESKKEEKILNSAFPTKEVEASPILKKEQNQIKKPNKEAEIKPMPTLPKKRISKGKFRLITLGIGYGQSYGGAGGFIQLNTKARLSLHGGIGYFPAYLFYSESNWVKGTMLYSGGLKYYLPLGSDPLNFYLDVQFCGIGVEAAHVFSGSFYYGPLFNNVQKTLWGPSFLAGIEVKIGRLGLNGALGASYNITKADWLDQNIFLIFDLGLLLYF